LLAAAFNNLPASFVFVGLTSTLASAVIDIIRLAEHEPYGILGATLILELK